MENNEFIIKKLHCYIENFDNLTDEEIRQSNYFVLHAANNQINQVTEMVKETHDQNKVLIEQNNQLGDLVRLYRDFIRDSRLTKRFELYSKGKEVI